MEHRTTFFMLLAISISSSIVFFKFHQSVDRNAPLNLEDEDSLKHLKLLSDRIMDTMNCVMEMMQILKDNPIQNKQKDIVTLGTHSGIDLLDMVKEISKYQNVEDVFPEDSKVFSPKSMVCQISNLFMGEAIKRKILIQGTVHEGLEEYYKGSFKCHTQILLLLMDSVIAKTTEGIVKLRAIPSEHKGFNIQFEITSSAITLVSPESLAYAKDMIAMKNGEFSISQSLEGETKLVFYSTLQLASPEEYSERSKKEFKPTSDSKIILIIENNMIISHMLICLLESMKHSVFAAGSDEEALEICKHTSFDLVFLNHQMPKYRDESLISLLRQFRHFNNTPIVAIASKGKENFIDYCRSRGFDNYITRPFIDSKVDLVIKESIKQFENSPDNMIQSWATCSIDNHLPRVLIAEDNSVNQKVAATMLQKMGCDVEVVKNGTLALAMCKKEIFELIFMDLSMPEMSGLEATEAIREIEYYERVPIVALTAQEPKEYRDKCFKAGMNDFLSKPLRFNQIQNIINKFLVGKSTTKVNA